MSEDTTHADDHRQRYDEALARVRELANGLGFMFGAPLAASLLEVAASELRISTHGADETARYMHEFADAVAATGKPPSTN